MSRSKNRDNWTLWDYAFSWTFIAASVTANNPADVIRFRMQVMPLLYQQGHLQSHYRSCWDCTRTIYQKQGIKSFFKGNLSNLIRVVPSETLIFQLKEYFQRHFHYHQNLTQSQHFTYNTVIGVAAAMIVSMSLYPFEYIRQQLLNRTDRQGRSIKHYMRKTLVREGVRGIYKGASIFSAGLILFRGTYFGLYDSLKVKTQDQRLRWLASAVAVYVSMATGYPIDSVRRRLISSRGKYSNARECFWDVWRREGARGLYLGWQMMMIQSVGVATIFFLYDRLTTDYAQAIQ